MSILVDYDIIKAIGCGDIIITPFDRNCVGTNSYDVHLAPTLRTYKRISGRHDEPLNVRVPRETVDVVIPEKGYVLEPGELYLGSTVEYTDSLKHVPMLNGRSSLGRLGLSIHVTAGTGDVGFRGHWTMELFVVKHLRVYAGIPVGQLLWFTTSNVPMVPYVHKPTAKYTSGSSFPQASKLHEELALDKTRGR